MGTNYSRIPKSKDIAYKHALMVEKIMKLDIWDAFNVNNHFRVIENGWDRLSPWDEFTNELTVHLGKRSSGWKFCWNFHDGKYYNNKEELFEFIRSGRVVDEYGELIDNEEFIEMALNWDGMIANEEYFKNNGNHHSFDWRKYEDKVIDGLRVSSATEFS
jgi:hypothetical protein